MRFEAILAAIALSFLAMVVCVIAITPPANGYEMSVYDAYPGFFWILLLGTISFGVAILLYQAITGERSRWWLAGLAVIFLANIIVLLLPQFRLYVFYGRGDTLTHLGLIRDVLVTGHTGLSNYYPMMHLLSASLIEVAALRLEYIPPLLSVLAFSLYVGNMLLLARSISSRFSQVLMMMVFSLPLTYSSFQVSIHPSIFSLFMVPFLLYFHHTKEQTSYEQRCSTIVLLVLAFFIVFCHPITTLYVIVIFATFGFVHGLLSRFPVDTEQQKAVGRNFLETSLIMLIAFAVWYLTYSSIQRSVKLVYEWLVHGIGTPVVGATLELLTRAGLTPFQTLELLVNRFGAPFVLLLISVGASASVLHKSFKTHNVEPIKFAYAVVFVVVALVAVATFAGYFVENEPVRIARFPIMVGTIITGLVVCDRVATLSRNDSDKETYRIRGMIVIFVVIVLIVILSVGSVYYSPRTYDFNHQVTRTEVAGTEWLGRSKNPVVIPVASRMDQVQRFEDYRFGVDWPSVSRWRTDAQSLPSHFGYQEYNEVAAVFNFQVRYLVIFDLDRYWPMFFPENVRPHINEYTRQDFDRLNSDPTVSKLYCNGGFEVWKT